jgi:hypothetical protein
MLHIGKASDNKDHIEKQYTTNTSESTCTLTLAVKS